MSKWAEKQAVGLGGSAGTGKDAVFQILDRLGAYTIDSDEIANRVILRGAPGYQPIVKSFGGRILDQTGQIDRSRLYHIVLSNRQARDNLQAIIDPLINQALITLIEQTKQSVVVVKATNLNKFGLLELCDRVWVTTAPEEVQVANLARKNNWSEEHARQYIQKLPQVDVQLAHADFVLYNKGSRGALLKQVTEVWQGLEIGRASCRERV